MNSEIINLISDVLVFATIILSIVFVIGVVWRVEKELDVSFKLFSFSIVAFLLSEVFRVMQTGNQIELSIAEHIARLFFAMLFLAAILTMRDLVRRMDGEKKDE